jgi:recombination protein RecA
MDLDLAKAIAKLNKKFGSEMIVLGADIKDDVLGRMTTGSLAVDMILGGGFPVNQWHEIVGEASNGKTALALKTVAANQARDPEFTTVWVAAETWVPQYAEMCGIDLSRVYVVATNVMEEAYEAVIELVETKAIDCVVIDSLPALVPMAEDDKNMDEATVGRGALLTGKFFRKVGKASRRSLVESERPFIGIIINQYRMKIGVMYGDPRTTPGGEAKNYAFFTRLEVKRDEWIEAGTGQEKRKVGQTIKVRTMKNKSAPPAQVAYVDFYFSDGGNCYAGDFDFAKEIVALGIIYKIITRAGAYYSYGDRKWLGGDAVVNSIREEVDLKEALERDVRRVVRPESEATYEVADAL